MKASLRQAFVDLLSETCSMDLSGYQSVDEARARRELAPMFRVWGQKAVEIVDRLGPSSHDEPAETWQELEGRSEKEFQPMADRAFVLRAEVRSGLQAIGRLERQGEVWALFAQGERLREQLVQGFRALEHELQTLDGEPSRLCAYDPLPTSLLVRRVTTEFRRAMLSLLARSQAVDSDLQVILRSACNLLTRLIGRPEFSRLRVLDRVAATQLRQRLVEWLRASPPDQSSGRHLRQELHSYAVLLEDINHREELIGHDLSVIRQALDRDLPHEELELAVQPVFGRDATLDDLLRSEAPPPQVTARLIQVFNRLARPLGM